MQIDQEKVEDGSLEEDWSFVPPKQIKVGNCEGVSFQCHSNPYDNDHQPIHPHPQDPEAKKPDDWDERKEIPDPEDKKPEGWDDIPATIVDDKATKPEDWDDEEDGEWEPPTLPNPEYKGEWKQKMMENPDYKGIWVAPDIDNPEYKPNPDLYIYPDSKYVGFELWQVKAGTIFDNIIVTDSLEEAKKFADSTWGKNKVVVCGQSHMVHSRTRCCATGCRKGDARQARGGAQGQGGGGCQGRGRRCQGG